MSTSRPAGAEAFLPGDEQSLAALEAASHRCRGCELYRGATQVVFGAGEPHPAMVLVGEAPGDREDREGSPFVGPAGAVLDAALVEAGIARDKIYLTNAVKHFKFEFRRGGKMRIHKTPSPAEVTACRPWLVAELAATTPLVIVCLGATAARSLLGPDFRIGSGRGRIVEAPGLAPILATYHPSAILRAPDDRTREELRVSLVSDLRLAASSSTRRSGRLS